MLPIGSCAVLNGCSGLSATSYSYVVHLGTSPSCTTEVAARESIGDLCREKQKCHPKPASSWPMELSEEACPSRGGSKPIYSVHGYLGVRVWPVEGQHRLWEDRIQRRQTNFPLHATNLQHLHGRETSATNSSGSCWSDLNPWRMRGPSPPPVPSSLVPSLPNCSTPNPFLTSTFPSPHYPTPILFLTYPTPIFCTLPPLPN